jgi:hypothetical protein
MMRALAHDAVALTAIYIVVIGDDDLALLALHVSSRTQVLMSVKVYPSHPPPAPGGDGED